MASWHVPIGKSLSVRNADSDLYILMCGHAPTQAVMFPRPPPGKRSVVVLRIWRDVVYSEEYAPALDCTPEEGDEQGQFWLPTICRVGLKLTGFRGSIVHMMQISDWDSEAWADENGRGPEADVLDRGPLKLRGVQNRPFRGEIVMYEGDYLEVTKPGEEVFVRRGDVGFDERGPFVPHGALLEPDRNL